MKRHQFGNCDLHNRKGLSLSSEKPLEASWRKLILKHALHPLKEKWPLVVSPVRLNTWTIMELDRWDWAAGKEPQKGGVHFNYA